MRIAFVLPIRSTPVVAVLIALSTAGTVAAIGGMMRATTHTAAMGFIAAIVAFVAGAYILWRYHRLHILLWSIAAFNLLLGFF
jgi:hypothetical protein